ncbi:class I SAM-dependent methyltransferase [Flavobacterium algicola]|uniref:class I SAM-dependent methyltransferase n=1 Tax=Flavobacterium algicola TaxID=556529 RepID=UPI001EFE75AF|nr:methyltransferase domain-containing protein [Flavobacterium algicola]MCG9793900.1 class I SAM-dependent methyltransferase [Flavobacterium algicola]
MRKDINKYKKDWFIELSSKKLPISTYLVRRSLLAAVTELKPLLHGKVLDLACGIMPYKDFLMSESIEQYIGVDLEPTEYHHDVKPDLYWNGSEIPLPDASVDFVLATEFLEHYFDTAMVLKEVKRVLKPGGVFFFTVPSIWPLHEAPYDYHRFTPFALEEHFKKAEFSQSNIKLLGGNYYYFALSIALFFEFRFAEKFRKVVKPFLNLYIAALVKKDNKIVTTPFKNNQMYSGLYGFITK